MQKKEIDWLYIVKAFAIFLVVLGHNDSKITTWIYSFHMPLFFFVSGYLFSVKKDIPVWEFIIKKGRALLMPHFIFSIGLFIFWFIIGRKYGNPLSQTYSVFWNFIGILYAQKIEWMDWGVFMWFLPCLFVVTIAYFFISRLAIIYQMLVLVVSMFIGFGLSKYQFDYIWSLDTAFTAIVFYGIGYISKHEISFELPVSKLILYIGILLFLSIQISVINGNVDLRSNHLGNNLIYFYVGAISGILLIICVSRLFVLLFEVPFFMKYLSINSMLIFILHNLSLTFIKVIIVIVFKHTFIAGELLLPFVYSVCQILLLIPVISLVNNRFSFLIGK